MNCLAHIIKYILYVFNLIFVVCGILLIVLGSLMISNIGDFSSFSEAVDVDTIPILVIILGCIVFVVAFFGCCGAIRENICCTTTYAVLMFILFILQIALVVWIFVKRTQFLNTMGEAVDEAWKKNDKANGYPMNALQIGVCGILLIVLGSLMISNIGDFSSFSEAVDVDTIPILVIILGCIVFVVAFFGCCGAIRENICCTTTYAVLMFILFILQIALVVWIFVKRTQFLNTMGEAVDEAWKKNDKANGYPMNALQIGFKCCGRFSSADYTTLGKDVPHSCCGSMTASCPEAVFINKPGCREEFVHFWSSNTNIIRYGGIVVALVELLAFSFACCLVSSIRKSSRNF